jgi:hypothetical protein
LVKKGLINRVKPSKVIVDDKIFTRSDAMRINQLYHNWMTQILQLRPGERITRVRNLVWLMAGIFESKSVHLSKIAMKIPGNANLVSITRRLSRFLDNPAIRVREWYEPIARHWLTVAANTVGEVRLILDATHMGFGHQLLMVALAFHRRSIPIAWTWVKCSRGHSSVPVQLALLACVHKLLPLGVRVLLVGDCEFESGEVQEQVETVWGWKYALRQKPNNLFRLPGQETWQRLGDLVTKPGQKVWLEDCSLTRKHNRTTNLLAYWAPGEKTPWLLATNLLSGFSTLKAYSRREWIDEMFGDLKRNGFDLESSHLLDFMRLSRLTLVVALLHTWLMITGANVIDTPERCLVDRSDRGDLSIFQIGLRSIERCLTNASAFFVNLFLPIPPKLSGG